MTCMWVGILALVSKKSSDESWSSKDKSWFRTMVVYVAQESTTHPPLRLFGGILTLVQKPPNAPSHCL